MKVIKHSYDGNFDDQGRISIVPSSTEATTELDDPDHIVSIYFPICLNDDQKELLAKLAQALGGYPHS